MSRDPLVGPASVQVRFLARGVCLALLLAGPGAAFVLAQEPRTLRVSVAPDGSEGNWWSFPPEISGDGRVTVFSSVASNLVPGDVNDLEDVFVFDRATKQVAAVSVALTGVLGNGRSTWPNISADGRFVVFASNADNLVPGDTNGVTDTFVRDLLAGTTIRASLVNGGGQSMFWSFQGDISADGSAVAFASSGTDFVPGITNGEPDIFVHHIASQSTVRVSVDSAGAEADGGSERPSISGNGRFVAFRSSARNLVPGDFSFNEDIFVHDSATGITEVVSVDSNGVFANAGSDEPKISDDGRFVAFSSDADNLAPGDTNGAKDIFVRDRLLGTTVLASLTELGLPANQGAWWPDLSPEGRYVAFGSTSTNLIAEPFASGWNIFVRDLLTGEVRVASVDSGGNPGGSSDRPAISAGGRAVAFNSGSSALVPGPSGPWEHNYVHTIEGCPFPEVFCSPSSTSLTACDMDIDYRHAPLLSSPSDFAIRVIGPGGNVGICFFGFAGAQNLPVGTQGGALCIQPPLLRTAVHVGGGTPGVCTDHYLFRLAEFAETSPSVAVGSEVFAQVWARDDGSADGFSISDAIRFTVCP